MRKITQFLGGSDFIKKALMLGFPLVLQQLLITSVSLVDNLMVGQLGDSAIGAVASVNRYYYVAVLSGNGVASGGSIFISQFLGSGNKEKMKQSFRFLLLTTLVSFLVLASVALVFSSSLLSFITTNEEIIALATIYMRYVALSLIPLAITLVLSASLRAIGETKIPLYVSFVTVLVNTGLNYCLLFGNFGFPKLGMLGVGIAYLISRLIEMLILVFIVQSNEFPFTSSFGEMFHVPFDLAKKITFTVVPLVANEAIWSFGMTMMFKTYATLGNHVLSANSISATIGDIFFTLFAGLAVVSSILIAEPLGGNHLETAKENAFYFRRLGVFLSVLFAILMFVSSYVVPYLYSEVSMETLKATQLLLRMQAFCYPMYTLNTIYYFILRSGGDTKSMLLMDSGIMWFINVPILVVVSSFHPPLLILFVAGQVSDVIKMAVGHYFIKKEKWVVNITH